MTYEDIVVRNDHGVLRYYDEDDNEVSLSDYNGRIINLCFGGGDQDYFLYVSEQEVLKKVRDSLDSDRTSHHDQNHPEGRELRYNHYLCLEDIHVPQNVSGGQY